MAVIDYKALFCVLMISSFTLQNEEEETNPFVEAARSLLQDSLQNKKAGGQGLGGMVQSFMQTDGGKHLGEMFAGQGGDILSSIGSLLGGAGGNTNAGFNPQLIGQMVEMFSGMASTKEDENNSNVDDNNNEVRSSGRKNAGDGPTVNWDSMMDIAANFMSQSGPGQGSPLEGLMNLLPALMQTGHAHHDDETEDVEEHKRHEKASSFLPPFLNTVYVYWEHFKESELGRTLWTNSGLEAIFQLFTDEQGHFQTDRIFESMENHSFRRRWIRSLTSFVAEWVKHVADPSTQSRIV